MDLVDDYLRAVGALLPRHQGEDITAELKELILSRMESREGELARALTPDEVEAVLREIGHPLVVAARYREGPQSIVGPALYPFWLFAVKMALAVQFCVIAVVFLVQAVADGEVGVASGHALANGITGAATTIGFITAAAWIIERQAEKPDFTHRWRVKDLRVLELAAWTLDDWRDRLGMNAEGLRAARPPGMAWAEGERRESRSANRLRRRERDAAGRGLGVIVGASVFLLWWTGLLHFGFSASPAAWRVAAIDPGSLTSLDWTALKAELFWPVVAYYLAEAAWGFAVMARPLARHVHGVLDVGLGGACLAFALWIAFASPLAPALGGFVAAMVVQVREAGVEGPPLPLTAIVSVLVAGYALNGAFRLLRGAAYLITPEPWVAPREAA